MEMGPSHPYKKLRAALLPWDTPELSVKGAEREPAEASADAFWMWGGQVKEGEGEAALLLHS